MISSDEFLLQFQLIIDAASAVLIKVRASKTSNEKSSQAERESKGLAAEQSTEAAATQLVQAYM